MGKQRQQRIDLESFDNFPWQVFKKFKAFPVKNKTLLSIGSRPTNNDYILQWLIQQGYDATILEVWPPYVEQLKKKGHKVIEGDVRDVDLFLKDKYDVVIWWHGPEHIKKEELFKTTEKLKKIAKEYLFYCSPWGNNPGGVVEGNPYQVHLSSYEPSDFLGLGMKEYHWSTSGAPNAVLIGVLDIQNKGAQKEATIRKIGSGKVAGS